MADVAMTTTDAGGEISASVEETNRVRAELGMAPLAETSSKRDRELVEHKERLESMAKESQEEEMRERLSQAKKQRKLNQKVGGKSLGEQLESEEMDSAAAWVAKSRQQSEVRKEKRKDGKAKRKAPVGADAQSRRYDEMDELEQEESQVSGALVGHATDDFKAGEDVILTLADQNVIDEDGNDLNEKDEMLENVNMAEDQRRDAARDASKGGRYDPYGDNTSILHKYDDDKERTTVRLDASGAVDEAKEKKLAAIKARLAAQQSGGGSTAYDLGGSKAVPTLTTGSDYLAPEDAAFKKPAAGKPKKLRKKKKAEGDELDLDALAAADAAAHGSDHGSRAERAARQAEREEAAQGQRAARTERFERALANAEATAGARLRPSASGEDGEGDVAMGEAAEEEAGPAEEDVEVDSELYAALARARRVGTMSAQRRNEDFAAQRINEHLDAVSKWKTKKEEEEGADTGQLEFSETSEFCKAVRAKEDGDEAELPSHQYKQYKAEVERMQLDGTASTAPSLWPKAKKEPKVEPGEEEGAGGAEGGGEESEEEDEQADFLYEQSTSGGLGGALSMARGRGMLGDEVEQSGRMFDQKGAQLHAYEDDADVSFKLQYYDEYGRKMTQKQAFRQLSWKFHGKMPSRKRREKRMLEVEKQMAEQTKDRAMDYMDALQHAQQSTKTAHVVLSGVNAIKSTEVGQSASKQIKQQDKQRAVAKNKKSKASTGASGFDTNLPVGSGFSSHIPLG